MPSRCVFSFHAGATFSLVGLPKNYAHSHGIWNLYEFGVQRFSECLKYGFGTPDRLGRILLFGFEQFCAITDLPLSQKRRAEMRKQAAQIGAS